MKSLISLVSLLLMVSSIHTYGQAYHGIKSYPIYKKGAQLVNGLDNENKEIVRIEYDIIFTNKTTYRTLTSDWEYTIVGFADEGVKDLNLELYEYDDLIEKWSLVATSVPEDVYSIIAYRPSVTAQYKIEIIANEFHEGYTAARYGLLIFHD